MMHEDAHSKTHGSKDLAKLTPKDFLTIRDSISQGQVVEAVIVSGSMAPLIRTGDKIQILDLQKLGRPLRRFDLVVFKQNDLLVCHYIWHLNSNFNSSFVTRSLISNRDDFPIEISQIIGYVPVRIPILSRLRIVFENLVGNR